ncbi:MAG: hypothetical protein ACYS72_04695 [Planctomycetota bacterium]|jgi:hypothetical protein
MFLSLFFVFFVPFVVKIHDFTRHLPIIRTDHLKQETDMGSISTLLASSREVIPCYELHEHPYPNFGAFFFPDGFIVLVVFWVVVLGVIALGRSQIGIFKKGLPVLPCSRWFYVSLVIISLVGLILLYHKLYSAMQCV